MYLFQIFKLFFLFLDNVAFDYEDIQSFLSVCFSPLIYKLAYFNIFIYFLSIVWTSRIGYTNNDDA